MSVIRRAIFIVLAAAFAAGSLSSSASAETFVTGHITADTAWTLAGSPYVMTTSVTVDEGATLTIEPGVEVQATSSASLNVLGVLRAVGTETNRIIFEPSDDDWQGIRFGVSSSTRGTDTRSALEYTEVWDVHYTAITLTGMAPSISHNLFVGGVYALTTANTAATLNVTDSVFAFNQVGVYGYGMTHVNLLRNDFWMNNSAIEASGAGSDRWELHQNDIIGTPVVNYLAASFSEESTIDATDNWWGTTDSTYLQNHILDGEDDPNYAVVVWNPPATEANTLWAGHKAIPSLVLSKHLIAKGAVTSSDGYAGCQYGVRVLLQRRRDGRRGWDTLKSVTTTDAGTFRMPLPDRTGRYRASLPYSLTGPPSGSYCEGGFSSILRHRH